MKQIIFLVAAAFCIALYFYPLSAITSIGTDIGNHLLEQAQR